MLRNVVSAFHLRVILPPPPHPSYNLQFKKQVLEKLKVMKRKHKNINLPEINFTRAWHDSDAHWQTMIGTASRCGPI